MSQYSNTLRKGSDDVANIILFIGATVGNQQNTSRILTNLRDSMGRNDFLVIGAGLETNEVKLSSTEPHNQYHYKRTTWILDYLGLENCYPDTTLDTYNPDRREYIRKISIQKEVSTSITIDGITVPLFFPEGSKVLVSRFRRFREEELVHEIISHNFALDQFVSSDDNSYALIIARPKKVV